MNRALAIDLGEARVGVAVSDDLGMLAHPLETIYAGTCNVKKRVLELILAKQVETVVVGMPRNMDGSFGPAAEKARAFITELREKTSCRVVEWDERLTTVSAQRSLQAAGKKAREHKAIIDQVAAQILLQSWMDAQA